MGGGGFLSPVTDVLFGKAKEPAAPQVDIPEPMAPAPPAPSRKVDTGAIVRVGQSGASDRLSGRSTGSSRRSASTLSGLGRGSGISI
jgi:hypothetical protein